MLNGLAYYYAVSFRLLCPSCNPPRQTLFPSQRRKRIAEGTWSRVSVVNMFVHIDSTTLRGRKGNERYDITLRYVTCLYEEVFKTFKTTNKCSFVICVAVLFSLSLFLSRWRNQWLEMAVGKFFVPLTGTIYYLDERK